MKYRRLSVEELQSLEPEFVKFLAANSISASEWEMMKKINPQEVDALIEQFSDIVLEKVLKKINYIEHRSPKSLKIFQCLNEKMVLVGLMLTQDTNLDLTQINDLLSVMQTPIHLSENAVQLFKTENPYQQTRELAIFHLLQKGCMIGGEKLFALLEKEYDKIN